MNAHPLRPLLLAAGTVLLAGFLSSGSCHVHYDSDHCDDDRHDHDCRHHSELGSPAELSEYRPTSFATVPSDDPWTHPVGGIVDIEGLAVTATGSPVSYGTFSDKVIAANPTWFALAPEAGELVRTGVHAVEDGVLVRYVQVRGHHALGGTRVELSYAPDGSLRTVLNRTYPWLGSAVPGLGGLVLDSR